MIYSRVHGSLIMYILFVLSISCTTSIYSTDEVLDKLVDPEVLKEIEATAQRLEADSSKKENERGGDIKKDDLLPSERRELENQERSLREDNEDDRNRFTRSSSQSPSYTDDRYRPGQRRPGDALRGTPSRSLGNQGNNRSSRLGRFGD